MSYQAFPGYYFNNSSFRFPRSFHSYRHFFRILSLIFYRVRSSVQADMVAESLQFRELLSQFVQFRYEASFALMAFKIPRTGKELSDFNTILPLRNCFTCLFEFALCTDLSSRWTLEKFCELPSHRSHRPWLYHEDVINLSITSRHVTRRSMEW